MTSFKLPFSIVGGSVGDTRDQDTAIKQKILDVLVTANFERPMIPEYGVGIQHLLFDQIDELVEIDFRTEAIAELTDRVSGVTILDLSVDQTSESEVSVTVAYRTPLSPIKTTTFSLPLGLLTEESEL